MVKFNTAALPDPTLVTLACDPAAPVVTVPTLTVAAAPEGPVAPKTPFTANTAHCAGDTSGCDPSEIVVPRYVAPLKTTTSFA
jgi:hypothetical protein